MTTKNTVKRGTNFATKTLSTELRPFKFIDTETGEDEVGGYVLFGPDSEVFKRAHHKVQKDFADSKKGKDGAIEEWQWEDHERLEKVVTCVKTLTDCFIGDKEYSDNKDDIREFFTLLPIQRDQVWARLSSRANFLNRADKAGSAT